MLKKSVIIIGTAASLMLVAGCQVLESTAAAQIPARDSLVNQQQLGQAILAAFQSGDYRNFEAALKDTDHPDISEAKFKALTTELASKYGKMTKIEFLGELYTPLFQNFLYKVSFERPSKHSKPIFHQQLFRLIIGQLDRKVKILEMEFI